MPPVTKKTAATTTASSPRRTVGARTQTAGRTAASGFKYTGRTPEEIKDRASRAVGGRDSYFNPDIKYFTAREGVNTVRILPMPPGKDWRHYGFQVYAHYDIGPDKSSYLCLAKMKGEACPICDERTAASGAGHDDLAKVLRFGERVPMFVIDRANPKDGPMLWNVSGGMDKDVSKLCIDPSTGEILLVDHPDEGYDLSFTRTGTGLKTKYSGFQFSRRAGPLSDDPKQADDWLKYIVEHPIDEMLVFHEADYIAKILDGQPAPPAAQPDPRSATHTESGGAGAGPRIAPRTKAPAAEPEPATGDQEGEVEELPTWDDLLAMNETELGELGDGYEGWDWGTEAFEDEAALRVFVANQLEIPIPVAAPAAKTGSWKDRFNKNKPA